MNTIQSGILNSNFQQAKECIVAPITDAQSFSVGTIVKICQDLFIPIQNIYYHLTCLTEDKSSFPQSVSEQCKGYLKNLDNDTTAASTFNVYGSELQNHIAESSKYAAPCKVEDCNVMLNNTVNQITKIFSQDSTMNSTWLSTKSDSNNAVYYSAGLLVVCAMLALGFSYLIWNVLLCNNETEEDNNHIQNTELAADDFINTQTLLNNYHTEDKYESVVELTGDSGAISV